MIYEYTLSAQREDFYNITPQVREAVSKSGEGNSSHRQESRTRVLKYGDVSTPYFSAAFRAAKSDERRI